MGQQQKKERENRFGNSQRGLGTDGGTAQDQAERIAMLQDELSLLSGSDSLCELPPDCPSDMVEAGLKDIIAFESVDSGISLFEGLQRNGVDLPRPEELNEKRSRRKVMEILKALVELGVFLVGFEEMNGRKLYATLWHQTLWEGCYVKRRHPGSVTLIDVSRRMPKSEMRQILKDLVATGTVH